MPHAVADTAIVQALEGVELVAQLVADLDEEEAPLSTVDRDLADEFIEALLEEALSDRANANDSGLGHLKLLVQVLLQVQDLDLCGGRWRDITYPQFALVVRELFRRQDGVEEILSSRDGGCTLDWRQRFTR